MVYVNPCTFHSCHESSRGKVPLTSLLAPLVFHRQLLCRQLQLPRQLTWLFLRKKLHLRYIAQSLQLLFSSYSMPSSSLTSSITTSIVMLLGCHQKFIVLNFIPFQAKSKCFKNARACILSFYLAKFFQFNIKNIKFKNGSSYYLFCHFFIISSSRSLSSEIFTLLSLLRDSGRYFTIVFLPSSDVTVTLYPSSVKSTSVKLL